MTISTIVLGVDDSGKSVADSLGLICHECEHPQGKNIDLQVSDVNSIETIAQEFVATVELGDDFAFLAFDNYLENKLLFTGAFGDSIWSKNSKPPYGTPVRVPYGKSLSEYRLRKGFSQIPMPTIGATFPMNIFKLNFLKEMQKFSVGGHYNRPIPRRFAELAGVKRNQFGLDKKSVNPKIDNVCQLKAKSFEKQISLYAEAATF